MEWPTDLLTLFFFFSQSSASGPLHEVADTKVWKGKFTQDLCVSPVVCHVSRLLFSFFQFKFYIDLFVVVVATRQNRNPFFYFFILDFSYFNSDNNTLPFIIINISRLKISLVSAGEVRPVRPHHHTAYSDISLSQWLRIFMHCSLYAKYTPSV